jgi:hypothetical protein
MIDFFMKWNFRLTQIWQVQEVKVMGVRCFSVASKLFSRVAPDPLSIGITVDPPALPHPGKRIYRVSPVPSPSLCYCITPAVGEKTFCRAIIH